MKCDFIQMFPHNKKLSMNPLSCSSAMDTKKEKKKKKKKKKSEAKKFLPVIFSPKSVDEVLGATVDDGSK